MGASNSNSCGGFSVNGLVRIEDNIVLGETTDVHIDMTGSRVEPTEDTPTLGCRFSESYVQSYGLEARRFQLRAC